jgi:crossover junction endodeoxyribonuclease RuvC
MANNKTRIVGIDTSFSSPGIAVVDVKNRKPSLIATSHVKTDGKHAKQSKATRSQTIYAWAHLFIREHMPFDVITREDFTGRTSRQNYPVFSAWNSVDRALADFGYVITEKPITPQTVKKTVAGTGRAEKDDVARAVRKLTGYTGDFPTDDTSDAAAIALCWAIQQGVIKSKGSD